MAKMKVIDDEKLNALGEYFDEHSEDENEWGKSFSPEDCGSSDIVEAAKKHSAKQKPKSVVSQTSYFCISVNLANRLKKKAKTLRKPYQRFVNEVLARAAL